jgi:transcriptional regulator with XRE-family HTH domain
LWRGIQSEGYFTVARPENPLEYTANGEIYRGSLVRELRWKKGLSREEAASRLGRDPDSLSKVETNGVNASEQMLSKIAELLEVPVERFKQAPVHPRILRRRDAQTDIYGRRMPLEEAGGENGGSLISPALEDDDFMFGTPLKTPLKESQQPDEAAQLRQLLEQVNALRATIEVLIAEKERQHGRTKRL